MLSPLIFCSWWEPFSSKFPLSRHYSNCQPSRMSSSDIALWAPLGRCRGTRMRTDLVPSHPPRRVGLREERVRISTEGPSPPKGKHPAENEVFHHFPPTSQKSDTVSPLWEQCGRSHVITSALTACCPPSTVLEIFLWARGKPRSQPGERHDQLTRPNAPSCCPFQVTHWPTGPSS